MSEFAGNILGTRENPLVTAARGDLFVPVAADKQPNVIKRILIGGLVLAVVTGAILLANRLYRERITLPELNTGMIGKRVAEIVDVPETVEYADVEFTYEIVDFEGLVTGCQYTAKGNADDLSAVVEHLLERYGSPGDFDKMALSVLTKEDLATLGTATWTWDYGKRKVESLEALDGWGSNVAGYYINPTYLYMDLIVTAGADEEVDILIRYEARTRY